MLFIYGFLTCLFICLIIGSAVFINSERTKGHTIDTQKRVIKDQEDMLKVHMNKIDKIKKTAEEVENETSPKNSTDLISDIKSLL